MTLALPLIKKGRGRFVHCLVFARRRAVEDGKQIVTPPKKSIVLSRFFMVV